MTRDYQRLCICQVGRKVWFSEEGFGSRQLVSAEDSDLFVSWWQEHVAFNESLEIQKWGIFLKFGKLWKNIIFKILAQKVFSDDLFRFFVVIKSFLFFLSPNPAGIGEVGA